MYIYIHTHTHADTYMNSPLHYIHADFAGNRNLLLNKGFGAFATALDERKQRERDDQVARELKENKEAALQGCK